MSEFAKESTEKVDAVKPEEEEDNNDNAGTEGESTATFAPLVQLEQVEVKNYEEDEEVLYLQRSKLFEFGETLLDKGTGNKTWKDKGVGDVKFLKHRDTNKIRILMRQEKTLKVIINQFLDPRTTLCPNSGNDKSWVWVAYDFSEGELVEKTFAIKFSTSEIAQAFKIAYTSAQEQNKVLLAGLDSKEGTGEADEIAEAVSNLTVKGEEAETTAAAEEVVAPAPAAGDA